MYAKYQYLKRIGAPRHLRRGGGIYTVLKGWLKNNTEKRNTLLAEKKTVYAKYSEQTKKQYAQGSMKTAIDLEHCTLALDALETEVCFLSGGRGRSR